MWFSVLINWLVEPVALDFSRLEVSLGDTVLQFSFVLFAAFVRRKCIFGRADLDLSKMAGESNKYRFYVYKQQQQTGSCMSFCTGGLIAPPETFELVDSHQTSRPISSAYAYAMLGV